MAREPTPVRPATAPTRGEPQVGDTLGSYELVALAGEGGMGRVFRARHVRLERTVAIKVLRRKYAARADAIERFFREARAVGVLAHPNLVEITDLVADASTGEAWYVMEWLDGRPLAALIAETGTLPWREVVALARQMASALAAVHNAGIVHRDVSPHNVIIVEQNGERLVKLLDFGVVQLRGTAEGAVAGTPAYLAPECARGDIVDGRADMYSLGAVLYEMLAGVPPFLGESFAELAMKHMTARLVSVAEVAAQPMPRLLAETVDRCLAKTPAARFGSMEALADALEVASAEPAATARPRWLPFAVAGGALAVLLVAALAWSAARPAHGSAALQQRPVAEARVAVKVDSTPEGAEVSRDGVLLGTTPCELSLRPGHATLDVELDGYRPASRTLELVGATAITVPLEVLPAPPPSPEPTKPAHPPRPRRPDKNATVNPFGD